MFSEELGGNTTKRRQEEARARRRQLKQQQQKQAEQQKAHEAAIASIAATAPSSVIPPNASLALVDPTPILPTSSGAKPSAVANALQQRQIRAQAQQHRKAIVTIQSFYRACQSNRDLLTRQSTLLQQRLKDIGTLRDLLKQKANTDYIPPPATSTALVQQLIFLSKSIPYKRKADAPPLGVKFRDQSDPLKLSRLLQFVILPGIKSPDENVNPFFVWMQSRQGLARLESLLRLCLVAATMPHVDIKVLGSVTTFLQAVLVAQDSKTPFTIVQKYRSLLVSSSTPSPTAETKSTQKNKPQPHTKIGSNLDIICILRYHLLYCTGGPHPIPPASSKLRERCIPEKDRAQADALFQLVLQVTLSSSDTERSQLFLRFVSEIFTIPLLPWKISATSTSKLLAPVHNTNSMILIHMLETFVGHYGPVLSAGKIDSVLASDTSLTSCPATSSQSLLANLIQISRVSTKLNGSNISQLDFSATTRLFKFIATLVDAVPLGTFLSRESVVEWISDGMGHHSPVVLSPIVMEQCKLLLVDAFVRKLFTCAIDEQALNTEHVLLTKNEKDLKHEVDLQEAGQSASTLAAKEARVDRSRGFWNSSAWARKVTKGVSKMLSGESDSKPASSSSNAGKLINTSSVSRTLAESGGKGAASSSSALKVSRVSYTPDLLIALCRVYGIVLARMGGGGKEDIVKRARDVSLAKRDGKGVKKEMATATTDPCTQTLLNVVCFSTPLIRVLWGLIQSDSGIVSDLYAIIDPNKGRIPVRGLCIRPSYPSSKGKRLANDGDGDGAALLYVFICALSHVLIITDDTDIHDLERPIPLHQLRRCIQTLKKLLYRTCCLDDTENSDDNDSKGILQSNYFGLALVYAASRTMRDLYDRSSRRPFCVPKLWLVENLMENDIRRCKTHDQFVALLSAPVLKVSPFLVSFKRRLKIFERIVTTSRVEIQGENSQNPFNTNPLKPGIPVRITRGRILEDGLATLNNLGRNMRQRIAVQYHNEAGTRESGIDAGGLFKEFWTDLSAIAFNPNYALFRVTEGATNCMYPSPASRAAHGPDHIVLFEFLGRILGKALYEGITIHPQFAHFFLSFLRGDYNYFHMLPDLFTMDAQLYNNLMFLKNFDGDAEDLCLTFTVANDDFGGNTEVPLLPNGADISVTNANKQRYIGLVAKHYVVDRLKEQSEAFTRGLWEVIDGSWLRLFNEPELQVLISGPSDGKIDVADMRSNARYAGGYTGIDRTVNRFWNVVASFNSKQQASLLRFVTSCERPPPLGFACMNPPFTIQRVGILRDADKLPSASTCFNTLKLPTYSSEKVLRERLIYAIESGSGFELS